MGSAEDTKGPRLLSHGAPPPSLTSLHDLVSLAWIESVNVLLLEINCDFSDRRCRLYRFSHLC